MIQGKIVISDFSNQEKEEYSKDLQNNNKLLREIALKIKELVNTYRTEQKQRIEEHHKKLMEDLENF